MMNLRHLTIGARPAAALLAAVSVTAALAWALTPASAAPLQVARIEPQPPVEPRPYIIGPDPLGALLRAATVLAPISYENLTLFPVTASSIADFGSVLTMEEALRRDLLVIEEVGSGSVNEVIAVNRSDRYIFIMASEMIGGAKQDRTLGEDVLLAPHSKARIPVFCVEAHRWTAAGPDAKFRPMAYAAPMAVRRTARLKQDQSEVWAEVQREQTRLAAPSATGAVRSVYESADVQRRVEPYLKKMDDVPSAAPNVIGVVVARGDDIICADLFYRPDLLRRLWPKLVRSYAADAIGEYVRPGRATPSTLRRAQGRPEQSRGATGSEPALSAPKGQALRDAERFLAGLYHARRERLPTPGEGYALRLHEAAGGRPVSASALIFKRSVVHLEVFPGIEILPQPLQRRPDMNLRFRRERLEQGGR
jgi:hypothetical protein